jgi:hypothetical protein
MVNSYGWKTVCAGLSARGNRYFDIKWRLFRIFGTTRRFDGNPARLKLGAYSVQPCCLEKRRNWLSD